MIMFFATLALIVAVLLLIGLVVAFSMAIYQNTHEEGIKAAPDPRSNFYRKRMDI
jgi:uncharacterized protein YpmB